MLPTIKLLKDNVVKIARWRWTQTILGGTLATAMLLNATSARSPLIGLPASLLIFYVSSKSTAELFFPEERAFVREVLGFAIFISIASLIGTTLVLTTMYKEILFLVSIVALELILCFVSAIRNQRTNQNQPKQLEIENITRSSLFLLIPYLLSLVVAFYTLFVSRTGEGETSVWLSIPTSFLLFFFLSSLQLVLLLFFTRMNISLKLGLLIMHSLLSHSLFLVVWYPGRYGDPWSYLAEMRYIDKTGTIYAYAHLLRNFYVSDIIKYQAQYSLGLLFKGMFSLDVYWVHIVLIPLLWSILIPIFSYKIAILLTDKKNSTFPLLTATSAGLFSNLIYWGAVAHANSLGFILLLLSIMLLLNWFDTGKRSFWLMSLVASLATLTAHPQPGIFAFTFLSAATILKTKLPVALKTVSYTCLFFAYPVILYLRGLQDFANISTFFPSGLTNLENFLSFLSQTTTLLFVLVAICVLFAIRSERVKRKNIALLFLFYVTIIASYYFTAFGMANLPYKPERIIVIADILSVPFAALGLLATARIFKKGFSSRKGNPLKNKTSSLGMLLVCLFISLQATMAVYSAYPRDEISSVQPSWYEMEAVFYINSTTQRYVVISEPGFISMGIGFLGSDYAYRGGHGFFGVPEWWEWTVELWLSMVRSPSIDVMAEALTRSGAEVGYFVVSVRSHGFDFEDIIEQTSQILSVDRVFGNGKLYVFNYSKQSLHGLGPSVKVVFDDGTSSENVTSEFEYSTLTKVNYNITLSGHFNYNITEFPEYWTFSDVYVNEELSSFDDSSDINSFIYVSGLGIQDVVEVVWEANNLFPNTGWKEDSFKAGWQTNPFSPGTIRPTVSTDGNVLQISWNFTAGKRDYYHYAKRLNVSTDDFPYIFVRWRSTGPVADIHVAYTEDEYQKDSIAFSGYSASWTVAMKRLQPGKVIAYVEVGITSHKDSVAAAGPQTVYFDYVLISAQQ